ncbi:MAG TPA: DUF3748 domain-containing protein [Bryobacteraceae bacterium]|nr:DUF3748 domain-containing protein [Bryobacteraceae bacterium]
MTWTRLLRPPLAAVLALLLTGAPGAAQTEGGEWQLTASPISKLLDNNDNFSRDGRFLVYDTRDTFGGGIGNGTSIMKVSVTTGLENLLYSPASVTGTQPAPGLGAASFSPVADEAVFIHGPLLREVPDLGFYSATNRHGGVATGDGAGDIRFVDCRDVKSEITPPGALRGGSHRHEYTADGKRIGFTYDDALQTQYGRTIGFMVPHAKAPCGASHWAALLLQVVPPALSKPGDLERAADDSWVGAKGLMRAFIGNVKEADGKVVSSLFVVDIPENIDVTTANSGTKTTYPTTPAGLTVRRLTNGPASGIVRGSLDGTRIGYFSAAADGSRQVFLIPSNGSDESTDPQLRPVQVSNIPGGASGGLRWHPSGNSVAVLGDNGVAVICVKPGADFGKMRWITRHGTGVPAPEALVWSRDGRRLAFNRRVPTYNAEGVLVKDAAGNDFRQIFLVDFPDTDGDGIAEGLQ